MSGGSMEYIGFRIKNDAVGYVLETARECQKALEDKNWAYFGSSLEGKRDFFIEEYGNKSEFKDVESLAKGVCKRMWDAYYTLSKAAVYATRVEWLTSDDDGFGDFVGRVDEELATIERNRERTKHDD